MSQPDLTPVTLFTQLAGVVFGASVAMVVGPYIVILIGAMGGSAVAILQRESTGNVRAFIYFLAMTSASVMLTVPLSLMVGGIFGGVQVHWLFAPFSFILGYAAGFPKALMTWAGGKANKVIDALIEARSAK